MPNYFVINYDYLIFIGLLISISAQLFVNLSYSKYKQYLNNKDLTGYDVARKILDKNNLQNIIILETKETLGDHYDPKKKVIKLSTDIYHGSSIASLAVAAHECGHAIQDKVGYKPMRIRSAIVGPVNICTNIGYLVLVIGALFSHYKIVALGILLLSAILLFELITLPVELNASSRALKEIKRLKLSEEDENSQVRKMLTAAAFTYVASLITSLLQILRLVLIYGRRNND